MKLADYLTQNDLTRHDFAKQIDVSHETVRLWLVGAKGKPVMPQGDHLVAVIRATSGQVTANDFLGDEVISEAAE